MGSRGFTWKHPQTNYIESDLHSSIFNHFLNHYTTEGYQVKSLITKANLYLLEIPSYNFHENFVTKLEITLQTPEQNEKIRQNYLTKLAEKDENWYVSTIRHYKLELHDEVQYAQMKEWLRVL